MGVRCGWGLVAASPLWVFRDRDLPAHEPGCLLSRPSDTLSSARSGGEGRGEEVHGQE